MSVEPYLSGIGGTVTHKVTGSGGSATPLAVKEWKGSDKCKYSNCTTVSSNGNEETLPVLKMLSGTCTIFLDPTPTGDAVPLSTATAYDFVLNYGTTSSSAPTQHKYSFTGWVDSIDSSNPGDDLITVDFSFHSTGAITRV